MKKHAFFRPALCLLLIATGFLACNKRYNPQFIEAEDDADSTFFDTISTSSNTSTSVADTIVADVASTASSSHHYNSKGGHYSGSYSSDDDANDYDRGYAQGEEDAQMGDYDADDGYNGKYSEGYFDAQEDWDDQETNYEPGVWED